VERLKREVAAERMSAARSNPWTAERCAAFARDWEAGLDCADLREKYGIKTPSSLATRLRRKGYRLTIRPRGFGAGARMVRT
jgi:hypothetical protein